MRCLRCLPVDLISTLRHTHAPKDEDNMEGRLVRKCKAKGNPIEINYEIVDGEQAMETVAHCNCSG